MTLSISVYNTRFSLFLISSSILYRIFAVSSSPIPYLSLQNKYKMLMKNHADFLHYPKIYATLFPKLVSLPDYLKTSRALCLYEVFFRF